MDKIVIDEALKFYKIDDKNYKAQCYECLEYMNNNPKLLKEFNDLYEILFVDKTKKVSQLWSIKTLDKLFVEKTHPYITNLLLLSGYKLHQDNIKKYNLDDEQISKHKLRVRESLVNDIFLRKYNGIRISKMLWGSYFMNIRIIEVGRLQYEYINENSIRMHIPKGDKLAHDKVIESITKSKYYIEKYFNVKDYTYHCNSWLLSKQIHSIVNENSNIYKFYNLFNVEEGESCIEDILDFVYELIEIGNYSELPENTSLQRNIKQYLLNGNDIKMGKGILKI